MSDIQLGDWVLMQVWNGIDGCRRYSVWLWLERLNYPELDDGHPGGVCLINWAGMRLSPPEVEDCDEHYYEALYVIDPLEKAHLEMLSVHLGGGNGARWSDACARLIAQQCTTVPEECAGVD